MKINGSDKSHSYDYYDTLDGGPLQTHCDEFGPTLFAQIAQHTPNFCIVVGNATFRIVAFRGTNERADWSTNLHCLPRRSPWGWVHAGFQNASDILWPDVMRHMGDPVGEAPSLWITGHSLGGALAVLTAARLAREDTPTPNGVYTFGQPPVAYKRFARHFD